MAKAYVSYRLRAKKRHGVHSPFVYELSEEVFHKPQAIRSAEIEGLRDKLKRDHHELELKDYGAGSRKSTGAKRAISEIAKTSSTPAATAMMMQRLISYLNLKNVLELGTNLGITAAYLAVAKNNPRLTSLEGDPVLASLAVKNLQNLGIDAKIIEGRFEDTLDLALAKMPTVDFAYMDGNHRKEPTLEYFEKLLPKTTENSVLAIGDIHWSAGMEAAWEEIKRHQVVTITIDLFDIGLVFFRKDRAEKEHFTIRL